MNTHCARLQLPHSKRDMSKVTRHQPKVNERRSQSRTIMPGPSTGPSINFFSNLSSTPSPGPQTPHHPSKPPSRPPSPSHQESSNTTRKQAGTCPNQHPQLWPRILCLCISCSQSLFRAARYTLSRSIRCRAIVCDIALRRLSAGNDRDRSARRVVGLVRLRRAGGRSGSSRASAVGGAVLVG